MGPLTLVAVAGAIVLADRVTKLVAIRRLAPGGGVLRLAAGRRPLVAGAAPPLALLAAWLAAASCAGAALAVDARLAADPRAGAGIVAALAAAASNLGDRLARGEIVDFIAIGRWPAFNLADVAIVAGAAAAAVALV
jgi:signal peptidase II